MIEIDPVSAHARMGAGDHERAAWKGAGDLELVLTSPLV
jgi:hypothetical protein